MDEKQTPKQQNKPYEFEPSRANLKKAFLEEYLNDQGLPNASDRLDNLNWCWCENCTIQKTGRECFCCWEEIESEKIRNSTKCITLAENFSTVCLNQDVLETVMAQDKHKEGKSLGQKRVITNKVYRHYAYKNYIYWVHRHELCKTVRFIIPSCVVNSIRKHFPNIDSELYVGFQDIFSVFL